MPKIRKFLLTVLTILLVVLAGRIYIFLNSVLVSIPVEKYYAPEFPYYDRELWLNSDPLRISEMTGSVVVLFLWTFD